jgi:hypothetical protein
VEEKTDMKKRLGKSPDLADTFCILVEVAILNGFLDISEIRKDDRRVQREWKNKITNLNHKYIHIYIYNLSYSKNLTI